MSSTKDNEPVERPRIVIIGGGFGGLATARALANDLVDVTLIDRRNYHLFQPLLYQVATGELSPANIASPLRAIVRRQRNCTILLAEVQGVDVEAREVQLADGERVVFDALIVAAGASHSYFGHEEWAQHAPGLKTVEDATTIRARLLAAFERAERTASAELCRELLTFVIVGAGPTGIELAGAISEVAHYALRQDFRHIDPTDATIFVVEAGPRALSAFPEDFDPVIRSALDRLEVTLLPKTRVTDITAEGVRVECEGESRWLGSRTVLWAAGVQASPLGRELAEACGCDVDRAGRVIVEADLTVSNHPEIFVIGDLASVTVGDHRLPGLAPVAMQQGQFVAQVLRARIQGDSPRERFEYRDRGNLAVIGRYSAVAVIGSRRWSGFLAWLVWIFIHLMEITQFRNRLLVLVQWGWTFFTRDRSARLITNSRVSSERSVSEPEPSTAKSG